MVQVYNSVIQGQEKEWDASDERHYQQDGSDASDALGQLKTLRDGPPFARSSMPSVCVGSGSAADLKDKLQSRRNRLCPARHSQR